MPNKKRGAAGIGAATRAGGVRPVSSDPEHHTVDVGEARGAEDGIPVTTDRRPLNHKRSVSYRSFERADGSFEIEGNLCDIKGYAYIDRERGTLAPGTPVHDIFAVLVFDADMTVRDFRYELRATPFSYCLGAVDPSKLVGASIARAWRAALSQAFGAHGGCTHLRELVFGMGTVAFQTVSALRDQTMFQAGGTDADRTQEPFFLGGCHSWAHESPIVERYFPQYHRKPDTQAQ